MTVGELIIELRKFDPQTRVMVDGYEGGLVDVDEKRIFEKEVLLNYYNPEDWWYGPHEQRDYFARENLETVSAVIIGR